MLDYGNVDLDGHVVFLCWDTSELDRFIYGGQTMVKLEYQDDIFSEIPHTAYARASVGFTARHLAME